MRKRPTDEKFLDLVDVVHPEDALQPILGPDIRLGVHSWLTEFNSAKELEALGVKPRKTCLLTGPPGCGKTTLAHHLAMRLGKAMAIVRTDAIRSAFLGQSSQQIGTVFRGAAENDMVLFFDEFDIVATSRDGDVHEEDKNTTGTVLTHMERTTAPFFAATNLGDTIDPAVIRRFDLNMQIGLPRPEECFLIVGMYAHPFDLSDDVRDELARAFRGAPPDLIKKVLENIKRYSVLAPKMGLENTVEAAIRATTATIKPHSDYATVPLYCTQEASIRAITEHWTEFPPPVLPLGSKDKK